MFDKLDSGKLRGVKLLILTLAFHPLFVSLLRQNSKVCWLSRFGEDWSGSSLKGHPLWNRDVVFCWSEPRGFKPRLYCRPLFLFLFSLIQVYFAPETRECFPCLILPVIDWSSGQWPITPGSNVKTRPGGSLNFQSSGIELRCESMWRIISTLNRLHEPILQHRIHINSSGGVQTHAGCFFVFYLGCLTSEVLAFFTAFPHISDHNASSPQLQF